MAGSLDIHIASLSDSLIDGMSFANRATASYITGRKSTSFPTQSGGVFSSSQLRIMRFNMADSDGAWADGGTLRVAFTLQNNGSNSIKPNTLSPASLFRRARVLCGGTEIFDLLDYGRVHQLFSMMLPAARQVENAVEGWGSQNYSGDQSTLTAPLDCLPLAAGASRRMLMQLLCPFFSQGKMLPLSLLGSLVIELELDDADMCFSTSGNNWSLVRPMILCDVVQVDPQLSNSFAQHLLSGKELPISYENMFSFVTTVAPSDVVSIPIYRGFSRAKAVYVTFVAPSTQYNTTFPCPLGGAASTTASDHFRIYIQHGSTRNPLYEVESIAEVFYRNRLCAQISDGTDTFGIQYTDFVSTKFWSAFSLEKAAGEAIHSGTNTMGQILYINMKGLGSAITSVHVVVVFDSVAAITSGGIEVKY